MPDLLLVSEWLAIVLRWLHVITAIAWIGSSFYFIALDLGLRKAPDLPEGAHGEEWQVHGGGFYHIRKYLVAPAEMPEHLTWFKWESYATWLSGFALLCVVYYLGADLALIDPNVLEITPPVAVAMSLGSLIGGWLVYDLLCKSPLGRHVTGLMLLLFVMLVLMAWGYTEVFSARAALLHLGAFTATIMSANVFMIIIPNQRKVVAALKAGEQPAAYLGQQAKQRSLHNNYLTLPVIFLMLSNHYPLVFATPYNWVIASLLFLVGVLVRHFFNTLHARGKAPYWTWLLAVQLVLLMMWLSSLGVDRQQLEEVHLSPQQERLLASAYYPAVRETMAGRCSMCHTSEPYWEGIMMPPKGVVLDMDADIVRQAKLIYWHAGRTNAMPPANVSYMEAQERALIRAWYEDGLERRGDQPS